MELVELKQDFHNLKQELRKFASEQNKTNEKTLENYSEVKISLASIESALIRLSDVQQEIKDLNNLLGKEIRRSDDNDNAQVLRIQQLETNYSHLNSKVVDLEDSIKEVSDNSTKGFITTNVRFKKLEKAIEDLKQAPTKTTLSAIKEVGKWLAVMIGGALSGFFGGKFLQ